MSIKCCMKCNNHKPGCHDRCIKFISETLVVMGENYEIQKVLQAQRIANNYVVKRNSERPKAFKRKPTGGSKSET